MRVAPAESTVGQIYVPPALGCPKCSPTLVRGPVRPRYTQWMCMRCARFWTRAHDHQPTGGRNDD